MAAWRGAGMEAGRGGGNGVVKVRPGRPLCDIPSTSPPLPPRPPEHPWVPQPNGPQPGLQVGPLQSLQARQLPTHGHVQRQEVQ